MKVAVLENIEQLASVYQEYNLIVRSPFHDVFFVSEICSNPFTRLLCITNENAVLLSAFKINENKQIAACEIPGDPFITNECKNAALSRTTIEMISEKLGCPVYFPLVYEDSLSFSFFKTQHSISSWKRLPSLIISAQSLENGLAQIAFERIGTRALRRIKKFEKAGFKTITACGIEAMDMINAVEQTSWKGEAQQDMISRKQLHAYEALNRSPNSLVRVVLDKDVPVAYRFDYRAADEVYILKWSYNEQYKQYSPGFYLLVEDMQRCWKNKNFRFIDLYGSPDTLKTSICDADITRERYDFGWPEQSLREVKQERLLHDQKITEALENSKSLKSIYLNKDQVSDRP